MSTHPDATQPASRSYMLQSCGPCMRIAERQGIVIGTRTMLGVVEGFSHDKTSHVQVWVETPEGIIVPSRLDEVVFAAQFGKEESHAG